MAMLVGRSGLPVRQTRDIFKTLLFSYGGLGRGRRFLRPALSRSVRAMQAGVDMQLAETGLRSEDPIGCQQCSDWKEAQTPPK
jgi:hypothetical protein